MMGSPGHRQFWSWSPDGVPSRWSTSSRPYNCPRIKKPSCRSNKGQFSGSPKRTYRIVNTIMWNNDRSLLLIFPGALTIHHWAVEIENGQKWPLIIASIVTHCWRPWSNDRRGRRDAAASHSDLFPLVGSTPYDICWCLAWPVPSQPHPYRLLLREFNVRDNSKILSLIKDSMIL